MNHIIKISHIIIMSLNLLTVPNVYDLYCGSITQENPDDGNTPSMTVTVLPAQNLIASPAISISTMAIRGLSSTPPLGPQIIMNSLSDGTSTLVTMIIPQFSLITWTGSATINFITLATLPAQFLPAYLTEWTIPFQYSNAGTYYVGPALLSLTVGGLLSVTGNLIPGSPPTPLPFGPQSNGPVGPVGDIYVQYAPSITP